MIMAGKGRGNWCLPMVTNIRQQSKKAISVDIQYQDKTLYTSIRSIHNMAATVLASERPTKYTQR